LILSLPVVGLVFVGVLVGWYVFVEWAAGWLARALGSPVGLGISGTLAIFAGSWITIRIATGKSAPDTTRAAKLLALGVAAFLGLLGAALLFAAVSPQPASSTF
jgi:hypothetical protein